MILASMNPGLPRERSAEISERSITRAAILHFVQSVGLPWLAASTLHEICDRLSRYDPSVTLNAQRDGMECVSNGGAHYGYSNVSLSFGRSELNLEAWRGDTQR